MVLKWRFAGEPQEARFLNLSGSEIRLLIKREMYSVGCYDRIGDILGKEIVKLSSKFCSCQIIFAHTLDQDQARKKRWALSGFKLIGLLMVFLKGDQIMIKITRYIIFVKQEKKKTASVSLLGRESRGLMTVIAGTFGVKAFPLELLIKYWF